MEKVIKRSGIAMLWQAFQMLKESSEDERVSLSKIKSATLQLAVKEVQVTLLKTFDEEFKKASASSITFKDFLDFLWKAYFSKHEELQLLVQESGNNQKKEKKESKEKKCSSSSASTFHVRTGEHVRESMWKQLEFFCWQLCKSKLCKDLPTNSTENTAHFLWLLFNTFCDDDDDDEDDQQQQQPEPVHTAMKIPPEMNSEEAEYWMNELEKKLNTTASSFTVAARVPFLLQDFLLITADIFQHSTRHDIQSAAQLLVEEAVEGKLMQGYISSLSSSASAKDKKSSLAAWKPRWSVLSMETLNCLNPDESVDSKVTIEIADCVKVESYTEKEKDERNTRFQVTTFDETFVFEAADILTKLRWVSAFRLAMEYKVNNINNPETDLKLEREKRRKEDQIEKENNKRKKEEDEKRKEQEKVDREEVLKNETKELKLKLEASEAEIVDISGCCKQITEKLKIEQEEKKKLEKEVDNAGRELQNLQTRYQQHQRNLQEKHDAQLAEVTQQLQQNSETEVRNLQEKHDAQLAEAEKEREMVLENLISEQNRIVSLEEEIGKFSAISKQYEDDVELLQREKKDLEQRINAAEQKLSHVLQEVTPKGSHRGEGFLPRK